MTKGELEQIKMILESKKKEVNLRFDDSVIVKRVAYNEAVQDCIDMIKLLADGKIDIESFKEGYGL